MARGKKYRGPGTVAQTARAAGEGQDGHGIGDADGAAGTRELEAETDASPAGDWEATRARLGLIEQPDNPVCRVSWPSDVGPLWVGIYGTAKTEIGPPEAVTSDGIRHPL